MRTFAIEIDRLTKAFGSRRALDEISLSVPAGSVFGFLGPNGAGKSTTINILTGLSQPTSGAARIFGQDVVSASAQVRSWIGYLPDVPGFYSWMRGNEFLRFTGQLFGLSGSLLDARVQSLLDLADLTMETTPIGGYSRGMKQRLGLAQALINAPRLLLLDEPTSALDPIGRKTMLDMISALAGRTTIFFSTHILADAERVCDSIALLDRGRVIVESSMADLRRDRGVRAIVVEVGGDEEASRLATALGMQSWLHSIGVDRSELTLIVSDVPEAQRAIPGIVAGERLALARMDTVEPSLEEMFVELIGTGAGPQ